MIEANPLTSITALVPYSENGKDTHDIVPFKVFENAGVYIMIPLVSDELRKRMELPEVLKFRFANNRIMAISEVNQQVLMNIVNELRILHLV